MNNADIRFEDLVLDTLRYSESINTRNSETLRYTGGALHLMDTPLLTGRKVAWKNALREMEWFLSGSNNIKDLHPAVHPWWKPWADHKGYILNNYGQQLRSWKGVDINGDAYRYDQIAGLIKGIREHPFSRRNVITTWNTSDMMSSETPITNCHGTIIQAFVDNDKNLSLYTYQRSADIMLGLPHNLIQYWALLMWLAHNTGTKPMALDYHIGDAHIYQNHIDFADKLIHTEDSKYPEHSPELVYNHADAEPGMFRADDFALDGPYEYVYDDKLEMTV